jgi:DNA-binding MarR family transcriptional regulator
MRDNINDLLAFVAVATDQSFTRAAARLGTSQSSLSRTIRKLEERLGVRLLTRTTRSVSPTEAGERLLQAAPRRDRGGAGGSRRTPRQPDRDRAHQFPAAARNQRQEYSSAVLGSSTHFQSRSEPSNLSTLYC